MFFKLSKTFHSGYYLMRHSRKICVFFNISCEKTSCCVDRLLKKHISITYLPTFTFHRILISVSIKNLIFQILVNNCLRFDDEGLTLFAGIFLIFSALQDLFFTRGNFYISFARYFIRIHPHTICIFNHKALIHYSYDSVNF